jgi:hypothetical protein
MIIVINKCTFNKYICICLYKIQENEIRINYRTVKPLNDALKIPTERNPFMNRTSRMTDHLKLARNLPEIPGPQSTNYKDTRIPHLSNTNE